jgi:hypothetical protein
MNGGGVKCWGAGFLGQLGNGLRLDQRTPNDVLRFADQTIVLRPSKPAGAIAQGAVATFTAITRPLRAKGSPAAAVRFEVYRQVNGAWRLVSGRNVATDATGRATLLWTFSLAGQWYVRARALADATYGASAWSPSIRYTVR